MPTDKNIQEKVRLHPRNKNREPYHLEAMKITIPELSNHITVNKFGAESVDFANPLAVKVLNQSLLSHYYNIKNWEFPEDNLVHPVPGRADYLHYIADLLEQSNFGALPAGIKITGLDIGTGATCIYPLLGVAEYDWKFLASDTQETSLDSAQKIIEANSLSEKITLILQPNPAKMFSGILTENTFVDFTMCNPPFHSSTEEAEKSSRRKVKNLTGKKVMKPLLNFAGVENELTYEGGEHNFIHNMINDSRNFATNVFWFTTLVSKKSNLKGIYKALNDLEVNQIKTIPMGTANKTSRIIAWSFSTKAEQLQWRTKNWKE